MAAFPLLCASAKHTGMTDRIEYRHGFREKQKDAAMPHGQDSGGLDGGKETVFQDWMGFCGVLPGGFGGTGSDGSGNRGRRSGRV